MGTIQLGTDGKIADPAIRAAAQALLRCFVEGKAGDMNEKAWLAWALKATPEERKEVYIIVWRIFLQTHKPHKAPLAKIANTKRNQSNLPGL